jgi:hypothetical protein
MDGISCLREAISTVPVPGAPPRLSRDGAVAGLAFLDAALRLNHVRRLTERLSVVEHRIARRTTEVDISLNMLDRGQTAAAKLFQQLASHTAADADSKPVGDNTIWVPVARISRKTAEPIDIRDASGTKVPRLTQYETARLMASGLYRLLRESLTGHPHSSNPDTDLNHIIFKIHEPRWLIQAALLTLFTERNRPNDRSVARRTPKTVDGHVRQYRNLALGIFDEYADYLKDYSALLDVALNDHLLVVALDPSSDEHLLTYESPLYVSEGSALLHGLWRTLRASRDGYYVQYHTSIPSTLRSYHLVFESGASVDVSQIYLSTDADAATVESLESDLTLLAERLASQRSAPRGEPVNKMLELEMQTALRKVAELVRRRGWEASHAGIALPEQSLRASVLLTQAVVAGEAVMTANGKMNNSILSHPNISPENLRATAAELVAEEMLHDLSLENDPVTNRAHAYWRRPPERLVNQGRIQIRAGAILQDATGAGPRDALLYAFALAGISYLVACFLSGSPWPYWGVGRVAAFQDIHNPEAVIAVLLVVPGFLYTRLTLPDPHSISGHLRSVPRFIVRVCIFSMVIVAAPIAGDSGGRVIQIAFIIGAALPLASAALLLRQRPYGLRRNLGRMGAPKWATDEKMSKRDSVVPDACFSSSEESHD